MMRSEVATRAWMTAAETIVAKTAMKIAGMCRIASRNDEIIARTITMIVEMTVVDMRVDGYSYYQCDGEWFGRSYYGGEVTYTVIDAPAGY